MEYSRLGNTGLKVSRIALGCMSYGDPTTPNAHAWALTEDKASRSGTPRTSINSVPPRRSSVARSPLVWGKMHDGPGGEGLSRKAIFEQVDASLRRLGTDHIDLYQIHRFG
jgi:1-deoxyxylulose-5-phosphate synthase